MARAESDKVLLVDCGGVFDANVPEPKLKAEVSLSAMAYMEYNLLNLSEKEFDFGVDYLIAASKEAPFPFLASNLQYDGEETGWFQRYVVREIGDKKIGFVGIMPADAFPLLSTPKKVHLLPPARALNDLLPTIREAADAVVLLSSADEHKTLAAIGDDLVERFDMIIACGGDKAEEHDHVYPRNMVSAEPNAVAIGGTALLAGRRDRSKPLTLGETEHFELGRDVADEEEIHQLIAQKREAFKLAKQREKELAHQKMMENLQLSPEEFFQQYQHVTN